MKEYFDANKKSWNTRTDVHIKSEFYDMPGFEKGKSSLNDIELELLGDVKGKKVLHLQCHFGQDTMSLARMGAEVTGVDLSDKAIEAAAGIAKKLNIKANFVCCNIYDIDQYLEEQYDIIFTSYGVTTWLPDLNKWGKLISQFLKPGGKFIIAEFHPAVWMFDDDFKIVEFPYFNKGAIKEENEGTYTDRDAPIKLTDYCWNHGLAEVFQTLVQNGLSVTDFREYDYSPYACFNDVVKAEKGYYIKGLEGKLPMVFAMVAEKRG